MTVAKNIAFGLQHGGCNWAENQSQNFAEWDSGEAYTSAIWRTTRRVPRQTIAPHPICCRRTFKQFDVQVGLRLRQELCGYSPGSRDHSGVLVTHDQDVIDL